VLFAGRGVQLLARTPNLELRYLLPLLPTLLPAVVALALPYALAVAVALVYGRMVSDREVGAMRLSGMPLQAIVAPALGAGALLSALALWLYAGPAAGAEQALRARQRDLADRFLALLSGPDRSIALEGARISFGRYEGGLFHDVEIDRRERDTGRLLQKILGDKVLLRRRGEDLEIRSDLLWVLGDSEGRSALRAIEGDLRIEGPGDLRKVGPLDVEPSDAVDDERSRRVDVGHITRIGLASPLAELIGGGKFELKPKDMELPDLLYLSERREIPSIKERRTESELHGRLAAGATPLALALLVVASSLQVASGGRRLLGFLVALVPVFALHFPLTLFGRSLADAGQVPPAAGVWAANVGAVAVALALLRRASLR